MTYFFDLVTYFLTHDLDFDPVSYFFDTVTYFFTQ
ncbi:hypothetical protein T06_7763 [Trichinella sp. T6]|nr:hypothetical protein T06_7763 [Trichinella sp. T6]